MDSWTLYFLTYCALIIMAIICSISLFFVPIPDEDDEQARHDYDIEFFTRRMLTIMLICASGIMALAARLIFPTQDLTIVGLALFGFGIWNAYHVAKPPTD